MSKKKGFLILLATILVVGTISLLIPKDLEATIYGSISGQIITEDTGEELKDVEVWLYARGTSGDFYFFNKKLTDKNGEVFFGMLKEGKYVLLFIPDRHTGYYADTGWPHIDIPGRPIITLEKGKHVEVKKKALVAGSILIRIKKRDGTRFIPPPEKTLKLGGLSPAWGLMGFDYEPNEAGDVFIKGIAPDVCRFEAEIEGHAIRKIENVKIEKGKTTEIEFIIDLGDPTGIEGKVISSIDGGSISGADIGIYKNDEEITPLRMASDETGYFSIVGISQGIYSIWYRGKLIKEVYVTKGKKTWVELKLDIPSNVKKKISI